MLFLYRKVMWKGDVHDDKIDGIINHHPPKEVLLLKHVRHGQDKPTFLISLNIGLFCSAELQTSCGLMSTKTFEIFVAGTNKKNPKKDPTVIIIWHHHHE
jgi:hypothetical protein